MVTTFLVDFSRVILKPADASYTGSLNGLYRTLSDKQKKNDFFAFFAWNEPMVLFLESVKDRFPLVLFTTDILQTDPAVSGRLGALFGNIITAADSGLQKDAPESYTTIAGMIDALPEEILFIDDQAKNIRAARSAGMTVIEYVDHEAFLNDVRIYLS